jgi:fibronectin-binding autotransporter adhesin
MGRNEVKPARHGRGAMRQDRDRRVRPTVVALESRELLSTLTVSNTNDSGPDSLRAAVAQANANNQADTIGFSSLFSTPQTIKLTSGELELTDTATTTIVGPGTNLLTINGNQADPGFFIEGGSATISGLTVTNGQSDRGGGVVNQGGTLSLISVAVTDNVAFDQGGGVATQFSGATTMTNCTVSGNSVGNHGGGGLSNLYNGSTTLINCTISGNYAPTGGGLYSDNGTFSLTNCTVSGNTSSSQGGGLTSQGSSTTSLTNTIVAGNTGGDVQGALAPSSANNLVGNGAGTTGIANGSQGNQVGTPQVPINALLSSLGNYGGATPTVALLPGSPAIAAGSTTGAPATDQRGQKRQGHNDVGAFQSQGFMLNAVSGSTPQMADGGTAFARPLAVTVSAINKVEPVDGGMIGFTVPATGASAALTAPTAAIATGQAAVTATANATTGTYIVTASAAGSGSAGFVLTNAEAPSLVVTTALDVVNILDGLTSLREAISFADSLPGFQTIVFDPSVFGTTPQTITLGLGELPLTNKHTTTITGPGAALLTVSGSGASRVFDVEAGSAAISGLTVSGGNAGFGGGIYNNGGALSLSNVTVSGNTAQFGGGVANVNSGTTAITDCTISGNSVSQTGGGVVSNSGTLTVVGTNVSGNKATYGAGLANLTTGTATVTGGTFSGNTASNQGGGLFSNGPSLSVTNTTVTKNSAALRGGGLFNNGGMLSLTDATVTDNSANTQFASADGGGLCNQAGTSVVTGCTFSGNVAFQFGGGLYNNGTLTLSNSNVSGNSVVNTTGGGVFNGGTATLTNCTINGNSAGGGGAMYITGTTNLINCTVTGNSAYFAVGGIHVYSGTTTVTNTIVTDNGGSNIYGNITGSHNLIGPDVILAPLGDYGGQTETEALLPGSPAIGAGMSGAGIPSNDQRGEPRLGHVDIGAFQSQGFTISLASGSTPQSTMAGSAFGNPLAIVVKANNPVEPVDGAPVNFAVTTATGGATATLSTAAATISSGQAGVTATANLILGQYTATASIAGLGQEVFSLTNTQPYSLIVNTTQDLPLETGGLNSLRAAIAYANTLTGARAISFDPSVFGTTPQTITLTLGQLEVTNPATMTINGPGAAQLTVSGCGASRVFDVSGSAALLGLTISGGSADQGGGLRDDGGKLSLTGCVVSGNHAVYLGGGIDTEKNGSTTLINCTISGNSAGIDGGGLSNSGSTSLTDCTVNNNSATSSLSGSKNGGGLFNQSTLSLTNVTVAGNSADDSGGGLASLGSVMLTNCTVSGNSSSDAGGLLSSSGTATLTLTNSIIAGQKAGGDIIGVVESTSANNLVGDGTGMSGISNGSQGNQVGTAQAPIDPLLAALDDYGGPTFTMALRHDSPAIGGGATGTGVPPTDQRGFSRDGSVDIGAFESQITGPLLVNTTTDGIGSRPGQLSLRQAVNVANAVDSADTISFDTSVFGTTLQTITLNQGALTLTDNATTTITGPGAALLTVSGGGASRVFDVEAGSAAISGLTVTGGKANFGGGIYNNAGTLSLSNVTVSGNSAQFGGGVANVNSGTTTITDCTISGNSVMQTGGGVVSNSGSLTLVSTTVSGNSAIFGGGLANVSTGTATVTGSTFTGNTATNEGGGLFTSGSSLSVTNTTVVGNSAASLGGGLFNNRGTFALTNATISGNSAGSKGGGVYNFASVGQATLMNTIVAGQIRGGDFIGGSYAGSNNLVGDDPLLAPLGNYGGPTQTMPLLPGSPAIGGGTSGSGIPKNDQRGEPRSGSVDIGAFQSQGFTLTPATDSTPQTALLGAAFANSLAVSVTANNPVEPVDGGVITFAAPTSGASATLAAATAVIAGGAAGVNATANPLPGAYTVTASASGANQVAFSLTNKETFSLVVNTTQDLPRLTGGQNSLRAAIAYANSLAGPQAVTFDPSVFGKTAQTIVLTDGQLTLTDPAAVTITGPGASLLSVSGNNASRVMEIDGVSVAISGLTVTGGKSVSGDNGGGLLIDGGTLTLTNVTVSGNTSDDEGGGLYNSKGSLTLTNCTISGNAASTGAGLYNNQGTLTLTDCTISDNTFTLNTPGGAVSGTIRGGGLKSLAGTLTMTACTISGNSARSGAGLFTSFTTTNLTGCVISGNSAAAYNGYPANPNGGGMYIAGGTVSLYGCTISGNSAVNGNGGGVYNNNCTLTLTNTTVTGNSAATKGGGLYNFNAGTLTLVNATVTGNSASDGSGVYNSAKNQQEGTLSLTNTIAAGNTNNDISGSYTGSNNLVKVNPMLSPLGEYGGPTSTMTPLAGSPAIGGGTGTGVPATDQRGFARGASVDIGAFQTQTAAVVVNTTEDGTVSAPGLLTLRQAINLAGAVAQPATFDPAVFGTPQVITLTGGPLVISGNAVAINGPGAKLLTVNGGGASGVFEIRATAATISGLTITGGKADNGGGLYNNGGSLTLTDATVTDNSAQFGGGVANMNSGTTTLTDDTITSNSASQTGGGVVSNSGTVTLNGTTLSGNTAPHGGGLANLTTGTTSLSGGTIGGNRGQWGGGLFSNGGSLSLTGSTVSNNYANYGAGLYNDQANLTLTNATVTGNYFNSVYANTGGCGVWNNGGYLKVTGGTISNNRSSDGEGGGMVNDGGGTAVLTGTTLNNNYSQNGAAIQNGDVFHPGYSNLTLTNVTISGNNANHGGGVYQDSGTVSVNDSTISGNAGRGGGGAFRFQGGNLVLTNTTITGNTGYRGAGLECLSSGSVTLSSCSVIANSSSSGGGIYSYGASISLTNTIVASNGGGDITGNYSGSSNLINANPLVAPLGNYGGQTPTLALLPGSPAIAAGTFTGAPGTDQRNEPRQGHVDIGAFQSQGFSLNPVTGSTPQSAVTNAGFTNPLAVSVTAVNKVEPVDGGVISFFAPTSGASAMLSAATAVISGGTASVTANANNTMGAYTVSASANGAGSVSFALTNTESSSLVLTTQRDVVNKVDGLTSLREAIAYANRHPGPDTITFDPTVFGKTPRTIKLIGGPLVLTDKATTTIVGPGARLLTFKGAGRGPVFDIWGGSLALFGMTITGGNGELGGGLRNAGGTVALDGVALRGNRALIGGGLYNDGTATLNRVVLSGNRALVGGGLYNDGTVTLTDAFIHGNRARLGSGLFNTRRAIFHWRPALVDRPGRVRISIEPHKRTSWITSN